MRTTTTAAGVQPAAISELPNAPEVPKAAADASAAPSPAPALNSFSTATAATSAIDCRVITHKLLC